MERIIFFSLVIPILGFVLYLGGSAIMNGFNAKSANKEKENESIEEENISSSFDDKDKLSDEIQKLSKLLNEGVLTQEEFEKAKKKLLDN